MAVTVVETQQAFGFPASDLSVTLASPVAAGDLILLFLAGQNAYNSQPSFWFNGLAVPIGNFLYATNTADPAGMPYLAFVPPHASEGISSIRCNPSFGGAWAFGAVVLTGGVPNIGDIVAGIAGSSAYGTTDPEVVAWTSLDLGMLFSLVVASGSSIGLTEPAGYTLLANYSYSQWEFALAQRAVTVPGAEPAEPWTTTGAFPTSWASVQMPLYDLGLRVSDTAAYARTSSASGSTPGSNPPPNPVTPYQPAVNPLPPDPDGIVVPLAPWVPGTGPFRRSS